MNVIERMAMHEPIKLLAAELSLRCPGFAIIHSEGGKAVVEALYHVEDRSPASSHGKLLGGIYELLCTISEGIDVFVREKAFSRFAKETQAISKVVGIAD